MNIIMEIEQKGISIDLKNQKDKIYKKAYWYLSFVFLFIFVGFFPTYFSRLAKTDWMHHLHAIVAMSWLGLLITQTYLAGNKKWKWHRQLGVSSFVLAPLLVITALMMTHVMLAAQTNLKIGSPFIMLAFVDISTLSYFIFFYGLAIKNKKNVLKHQRYMVSTVFIIIPESFGRVLLFYVPRIHTFTYAVFYAVSFILLVLVTLIIDDLRKGKQYFAYWFSFVYFLILLILIPFIANWLVMYSISHWIAGV